MRSSSSAEAAYPCGNGFYVAAADAVVYVRIVGPATMTTTVGFKGFLDESLAHEYQKFVLDFSECGGFDSTFMGILLAAAQNKAVVVLVNASTVHRQLLSDVGVHRVVEMCDRPLPFPELELKRIADRSGDPVGRARTMLVAHENLLQVSPRNRAKFGTFVELLRKELGERSSL